MANCSLFVHYHTKFLQNKVPWRKPGGAGLRLPIGPIKKWLRRVNCYKLLHSGELRRHSGVKCCPHIVDLINSNGSLYFYFFRPNWLRDSLILDFQHEWNWKQETIEIFLVHLMIFLFSVELEEHFFYLILTCSEWVFSVIYQQTYHTVQSKDIPVVIQLLVM